MKMEIGDIDFDDMQETNEEKILCGENCNVGGSIFLGPIGIPDVETFPSNLSATSYDIVNLKDGDVVITAGSSDATQGGASSLKLYDMCNRLKHATCNTLQNWKYIRQRKKNSHS